MKKIVVLILMLALAVTALTGCSDGTKEETKDTLTIMGLIKTEDMDPIKGAVAKDPNLMQAVFGTLTRYDGSGNLVASMASWEVAEDGLTRNFTIKEGIKFQDGSDLTADDVIFTFERMMEDDIMVYSLGRYTWEKTGDLTFSMTPSSPLADPAALLANTYIIPSDNYSADAFRTAPIGAGAYKLDTIETDGTVKLSSWDAYWDKTPYFKNLIIKAPLESSAAVVALQNGEVDILPAVAASQLPLIREDEKLNVMETPGFTSTGVWFFGDIKEDVNLKLAISYAIDREKMIKIACDGAAVAASDLISSRTLGELAGYAKMPGYDVEQAKTYLAKSSYQGETLTLTVTSETSEAQCIMDDLKAIGINIEIRTLDLNSFFMEEINGTLGLALLSNGASSATTGGLLRNFTSENGENLAFLPEFDEIVNKASEELDANVRNELYKQALDIQKDLVNVAPLYEATDNVCYAKGITGITKYAVASFTLYPQLLGME